MDKFQTDPRRNRTCEQIYNELFSSVQLVSHVWLFSTPWTAARQASLSITNSWSLLKLMSIKPVMPSNHFNLCHPLLLLPSLFPNIRVFSNESLLRIRWPKYWTFSFSISPSNEYSGLISFRIDWFDLFAVQGTLKSLLQHHSSKASILQCSAFFMVQLSHPYMTSGKNVALTTHSKNKDHGIWSHQSWQIDKETVETVIDFILGSSKITADGDCSHEIKRCLLLGRKAVTNLDSILKSRGITLLTKVHLVKEMVGWHHQLNGHEFGWTLGVGDGQGGLACCSPWTRLSVWTELNWLDGPLSAK